MENFSEFMNINEWSVIMINDNEQNSDDNGAESNWSFDKNYHLWKHVQLILSAERGLIPVLQQRFFTVKNILLDGNLYQSSTALGLDPV